MENKTTTNKSKTASKKVNLALFKNFFSKLAQSIKNNRSAYTALLLFTLVALIFFAGIFLGYYYDQTSFLSMWNPWKGVIQNHYMVNYILSDQTDSFVAFFTKFFSNPSLWNSKMLLGIPYGAMLFNSIFYPLNIIFLVLSPQASVTVSYIVRTILSGYFMYIFLRQLKLSHGTAIVSSILYMFSAQALVSIGTTPGYLLAFIPLYFYSINKIFEPQFKWKILLLAISTVLILLSGFPFTIVYIFIFGGCYFLFQLFKNKQNAKPAIISYIIGSIIGIALTIFILLPTLEFFMNTDIGYRQGFGGRQFPSKNWIHLINPYFFGSPVEGTWWGPSNISEDSMYMGLLPVIMFIPSLFTVIKNKRRNAYYFLAITLLMIIMVFNIFGILKIVSKIPIFDFNPSTRLVIIMPFFVIPFIAYGFESALNNIKERKITLWLTVLSLLGYIAVTIITPLTKLNNAQNVGASSSIKSVAEYFLSQKTFILSIAIVIILLLALLVYYIVTKIKSKEKLIATALVGLIAAIFGSIYFTKNIWPQVQEITAITWRTLYIGHSGIVILIGLIIIGILFFCKVSKGYKAVVITLLTFLDLFLYVGLINPPTKSETYYPVTADTQFLQNSLTENERIITINRSFLPSTNVAYDIASIQGHNISNEYYKEFMRQIDKDYLKYTGTMDFFSEDSDVVSPVIDLLNIKYLISEKDYSPDINSIIYQKEFNADTDLDQNKELIQTFEVAQSRSMNNMAIRISGYHVDSLVNITLQLSGTDGILCQGTQEIPENSVITDPWIKITCPTAVALVPETEYFMTATIDRPLNNQELMKINCVAGLDRVKDGELVDNQDCKDLTFTITELRDTSDKYQLAFSGNVNIYENISPNRKDVFQIKNIDFVGSDTEYFEKLTEDTAVNTAFLDTNYQSQITKTSFDVKPTDKVEITDYTDDRVTISSQTESDAFIKIPDSYFPGWKAYIDGNETTIYPVDLTLRGIQVPAGNHTIVLVYSPYSLKIGIVISLVALGSLICYYSFLKKRGILKLD